MVFQTGTRVVRPSSCKGQIYPWKEPKAQRKMLWRASVIWDQISEIWPQKGQPDDPAYFPPFRTTVHCRRNEQRFQDFHRERLPQVKCAKSSSFFHLPVHSHSHCQSDCDQSSGTSVSFVCRKQHVVGGLVTACGEMLVSDVPQKKRNVDCTFERCVRQATERKTTVVVIW